MYLILTITSGQELSSANRIQRNWCCLCFQRGSDVSDDEKHPTTFTVHYVVPRLLDTRENVWGSHINCTSPQALLKNQETCKFPKNMQPYRRATTHIQRHSEKRWPKRTLWTAPVLRCLVCRDTCVALGGGLGNRLCEAVKKEAFSSTPNAAVLDLKNKSAGGATRRGITEIIRGLGRSLVAVPSAHSSDFCPPLSPPGWDSNRQVTEKD